MPCHRTRYDKHGIHTPADQIHSVSAFPDLGRADEARQDLQWPSDTHTGLELRAG